MHKLTSSQSAVLSQAAQRDDGVANLIETLKGGAAAKVAKSLIARKLVREVKAKPGVAVWRRDADGRSFSLVISNAGRKAIGVCDQDVEIVTDLGDPTRSSSIETSVSRPSERIGRRKTASPQERRESMRCGGGVFEAHAESGARTKKALLIEMLSRSEGASIDALMGATGWLPHTTRAALTGLRHVGYFIERSKRDDGVSVYRLSRAFGSQKRANVASARRGIVADRA